MEYRSIMFQCSYVVDSLVAYAYLDIDYGIIGDAAWRGCSIFGNVVLIPAFIKIYELAPY